MVLQIELVPRSAWGSSLSKLLKKSEWAKIRKIAIKDQNLTCYSCGEKFTSLDTYEVWNFDEEQRIQKLVGIIGVCKACHNTIHFGRAQKIGTEKEAVQQFLKVNECDLMDFEMHKMEAASKFYRLNKIPDWKLDVSWLHERLKYPVDELGLPAGVITK